MTAGNGAAAPVPKSDQKLETAILWCRRDLRVTDNPALNAALQLAKRVIPVYIWAPEEEGQFQPGRCSRWWLNQSLAGFKADLQALGSDLVFRRASESCAALLELVQETGAEAVVFNHLYDPISLVRDNEVKTAMQQIQVHCQSFNGDMLYEPWEVLSAKGQPFTCFQDFWDRMSDMEYPPREVLRVPTCMPEIPANIDPLNREVLGLLTEGEEMSGEHLHHSWTPGGKGSFIVFQKFMQERLADFSTDRCKTDRNSTSFLSPHIHYGELSIRFIYYVVKQRESQEPDQAASCNEFLRQMAFREYSRYLSFHFPFTHERSLLEHLRAAPWKFNHRHFKAWRQGSTGYPMVDASMRQLWSTGWLHNRSRVICASFLVKNLLLPWQWGLKHYWDCLLDADLECDALGWQYCSGCLADAHPFDYMMRDIVRANQFDPDGSYVRKWLPALARLPVKYIHRPWEAPEQVLADAGVELGVTYPFPVISIEESEEHLQMAAQVIQNTLAASMAEPQVPYRPPSKPSSQNHGFTGLASRLKPKEGDGLVDGSAKGGTSRAGVDRSAGLRPDEEVVSNATGPVEAASSSVSRDEGEAGSQGGEAATPQQQQQAGEQAGAAALKEAAEGAIAARAGLTPEEREPYPQPETGYAVDETPDEAPAVVPSMSARGVEESVAGSRGGVVRPRDESLSGESGCKPAKRIHVG